MKISLASSIISTIMVCLPNSSFATFESIAENCETTVPYDYDSGEVSESITTFEVSYDSPSIQLDLSQTILSKRAKLRITGAESSEEIDAQALEENSFSSQFGGGSVSVELIVDSPPFRGRMLNSNKSRVVINALKVWKCKPDDTAGSICGEIDDRVSSTDDRQGRIGGCTGWLLSENVFCQAGHCGTPSTSTRMHFTYGVSNAPVEDQYPVEQGSYVGVDGGVGNDWGCGRLLPNTSTGLLPGVAQGAWYNIGDVPSSGTIRITGYGTAAVDSRSQKTHTGALTTVAGTYLGYVPDTTGGNSGSPVVHEETGQVVGVHTHGGCSATGGSNSGTRTDLPAFKAHRDWLLIECTNDTECGDGDDTNGIETCVVNSIGVGQCQFGTPITESPTPAPACGANEKRVRINVLTDDYPSETSWTLVDKCGVDDVVVQSRAAGSYTQTATQYTDTFCLPDDVQYGFTINDSYGDGICCGFGSGEYSLVWGPDTLSSGGAFGSSATTVFGECATVGTPVPTPQPTPAPSKAPSLSPSKAPSSSPSASPTKAPVEPTLPPTPAPSSSPTTPAPTPAPTPEPTNNPTDFNCGIYTGGGDCKKDTRCQWDKGVCIPN